MMRNGHKIGDGTGFIYYHKASNSHFLITNYHVLTARPPRNPSSLLEGYPDSPDELKWKTFKNGGVKISAGSIDILSGDGIRWLEHKDRGKGVDIVAVKLEFPDDALVVSQENLGLVEDIEIEVGGEIFIVGFPFGMGVDDVFPLWKRGTIASEPLIKPNGLSMFYIDATTMPGMSGSPVFAVEERKLIDLKADSANAFREYEPSRLSALDMIKKLDINAIATPYNKKHFRLVGIYSGRLVNGKKDPSIGIVWSYQLVDELLSNPIVTAHPFPPHKIDHP